MDVFPIYVFLFGGGNNNNIFVDGDDQLMTSVRAAKSKGSQFEMNCEASLQQRYPDCYRTHERGYIMQYDLKSDTGTHTRPVLL